MRPHRGVAVFWAASLAFTAYAGMYRRVGVVLVTGLVSTLVVFAAWRYLGEPDDLRRNAGLFVAGLLGVRFVVVAGLLLWGVAAPVAVYSVYRKVMTRG